MRLPLARWRERGLGGEGGALARADSDIRRVREAVLCNNGIRYPKPP
jgi:hypothetical protein